MIKTVLISVTSDLVSDQRVHRTAMTFKEAGYQVIVTGRKRKNSTKLKSQPYLTHRFSLPFEKGPLFYASYNIYLFFYLLNNKSSLLVSNDLDTLLPNFLISKWRKIPLIYDSHEYFTGVPELSNRPLIRKIWKLIEGLIVPRLKYAVTVNQSIATLYEQEIGRAHV